MKKVEAHAVACLLADIELNGHAEALSGPVKRLCDHLADLPAEARRIAFGGYLTTLADPDAVVNEVGDIDPEGPPPEEEEEAENDSLFRMRKMSDIEAHDIEWQWHGRVPLGMLTLMAGDPKLGKSLLTLDLAAAVSTGRKMPGDLDHRDPAGVLLLSAEDDPARTIRPRLEAAGADLSRIHVLESVVLEGGNEALPSLADSMPQIRAAIQATPNCKLLVIDPVSAYIGSTDDHVNARLRGLLSPLKRLAEDTGVAVVLVTHLNKGKAAGAKYKVTGSIAYVGACRACFLFVRDPDDPAGKTFMADIGGNLAPLQPTLAYSVSSHNGHPIILWDHEPSPLMAEDLIEKTGATSGRVQAADHPADAFLRDLLAAGPIETESGMSQARVAGFTEKQIRSARERLGVKTEKARGDLSGKWYWRLPADAPTTP